MNALSVFWTKHDLCPSNTDCALVVFGQLSTRRVGRRTRERLVTPATEAGGGTSPTETGYRASVHGLLLRALVGAPFVTSTVLAGGRRLFAGGLSGSVHPSFVLLTSLLYSTSGRPVRAPTTSSPPSLPLPFLSVSSLLSHSRNSPSYLYLNRLTTQGDNNREAR